MQHTLLLIDGDGARVHPTRPGYYPIVSPKSSICKGGFRELRQRYVDNWPKDTIVPHGGSHQWREPCYLKAPARFVFFLPYGTHAAVCAQLVEKKCLASSPPTFRTVTAPQGANAVAIFLPTLAPTPPHRAVPGLLPPPHRETFRVLSFARSATPFSSRWLGRGSWGQSGPECQTM